MTEPCEHCGSTLYRSSLSAGLPKCGCGSRMCWDCYDTSLRCYRCEEVLHSGCAVAVGEDSYCDECGAVALKQEMLDELAELDVCELQRIILLHKNEFLRKATLEELLAASKAIADTRRAA